MSHPVTTYEAEPAISFDWHHEELFNNPPYSLEDMVHALADGMFIIEGKQSGMEDVEHFINHRALARTDTPAMWDAVEQLTDQNAILYGQIF